MYAAAAAGAAAADADAVAEEDCECLSVARASLPLIWVWTVGAVLCVAVDSQLLCVDEEIENCGVVALGAAVAVVAVDVAAMLLHREKVSSWPILAYRSVK